MTRAFRLSNELALAAVVVVGLGGVLYAAVFHYWRRGVYIVAAACVLGALLRLVLPARRVGSLAVRTRAVDVVTLLVLGAALGVLGSAVPA
ncbi:MAG TPA: DUF3017 domain-containing protein [Frankiaceae bacterium]|nr:DUF3017 domain-containing protein [Frankiaceae bacterium]